MDVLVLAGRGKLRVNVLCPTFQNSKCLKSTQTTDCFGRRIWGRTWCNPLIWEQKNVKRKVKVINCQNLCIKHHELKKLKKKTWMKCAAKMRKTRKKNHWSVIVNVFCLKRLFWMLLTFVWYHLYSCFKSFKWNICVLNKLNEIWF